MEGNGAEQTNQPLKSTESEFADGTQRPEQRNLSESSRATTAAAVEYVAQEVSLPAEGNPCQRQATAAAGDVGAVGSIGCSHRDSDSNSGSGFGTDTEETDCTSLSDLDEYYRSALEALRTGDEKERNVSIWLDKCQVLVIAESSELHKFATGVLGTACIGNVEVQSIVSEGGNTPEGDSYEQRFQAAEDYILAADQYFATRENARMGKFKDTIEETEDLSEAMMANSRDFMESMILNQCYEETCGETKANVNKNEGRCERPQDELEAKRRRMNSSSESAMTELRDGRTAEKSDTGGVENTVAQQRELMSEHVMHSKHVGERESLTTEGGAENPDDQTSTSRRDSEGGAVEGLSEPTATSSCSETEEERRVEVDKQHAVEDAWKRAQVIRKLVTRQREALSRMTATSEARLYKMFSECHFLLTCVKNAGYVCNSALEAHGMAQIALKIAACLGTADIDTVRGAAVSASQSADLAVVNCEKAVQLQKEAVSVMEQAMAPLFDVHDDKLLAERTVLQVTRAAEDVQQFVDTGADVNMDELANKLYQMESMIDKLSEAFQRAKNVDFITKQLAKKFDDAAFHTSVIEAVFGTSYFVLKAMAAAINALEPLS